MNNGPFGEKERTRTLPKIVALPRPNQKSLTFVRLFLVTPGGFEPSTN